MDHPRHRRLTVWTLGAWGVVWLALNLRPPRRWRCGYCGEAARRTPRTPTPRELSSPA